jgi:hypothetical protein
MRQAVGRRPQRGTHLGYGTPGTSGIQSRVGIHDRDKTLVRIGTWQDDLDPGPVVDHADDASATCLRLTLADRFRLAYAAIYAAGRCSCRNARCLG